MANTEWAVLPLRVVVGLVFLIHGGQKIFAFGLAGTAGFMAQLGVPLPTLAALVVMATEFLGGLALLVGFLTRVTAGLLAIDMLVALLTVHLWGGFFVPAGIEFVLTLLAACVSLAGLGAGPASIDAARARADR